MKIFAYDYAGAGCSPTGPPWPAAGLRSDIMLRSLLSDMVRIPHISVSIVRSPLQRVFSVPDGVEVHDVDAQQSELAVRRCIQHADAVWPVAPESGGILERISEQTLQMDRILIGSRPAAVRLTASKHATSKKLAEASIPAVRTFFRDEALPADVNAWVVKPDDGAGCTDTYLFSNREAAIAWIQEREPARHVMQPFVRGRHCSLSLLCAGDRIVLLGLNEQRMVVSDNQLHHMGSTVNSIDDPKSILARLARDVVQAVPGLWGYVGIDVILSENGPVVLEINPRMTTSHAGLHDSTGCNPTEMVIALARSGHCPDFPSGRVRPISVDLNTFQDRQSTSQRYFAGY